MRLKIKTGFSDIICKQKVCRHVIPSSTWRRRYRKLWIKCPLHEHENLKGQDAKEKANKLQSRRARLLATMGADAPMPKKRMDSQVDVGISNDNVIPNVYTYFEQVVVRIRQGTALAIECAHLVQAVVPNEACGIDCNNCCWFEAVLQPNVHASHYSTECEASMQCILVSKCP